MPTSYLRPGKPLQISDTERERLGKFLQDLSSQLERDNKQFFDCLSVWWDWYDGKPAQERRSDPWVGASNVVIPLIRIYSDAVKARMYNTVFAGPKVWQTSTQDESIEQSVKEWDRFQNWAADDNEFDIYTPTGAWFDEASVLGGSLMSLDWVSRKRYVFRPGEGGKPTPVPVDLGRGPCLTHWPRDQVMWQYGKPVWEAEYLSTQNSLTWGELVTMEQFDQIDSGYIEKCRAEGQGMMATRQVRRSLEYSAGQTTYSDELYDIRQIYIDQPVLRGMEFEELGEQDTDTPTLPLIVTFDRTTGTVLRVQSKPYYTKGWPFYEANIRRTSNHRNPAGIAKMLEPMQRGATQIFNQAVDTVTFANSVAGFTTDPKLQTAKFTPGRYQLINSLEAVREAQHGKLVVPDVTMINMIISFCERLVGINDPSLGREVRYGGHPSPATSTAMMLQESKELLRTSTSHARLELSRLGEDIAAMYQQFAPTDNQRYIKAIGADDAQVATQWMTSHAVYGSLDFDLHALTESVNPEAEREKAIFVMQATGSYYTQILQLFQVAAHPNTPPEGKSAAIQAVTALTTGFSNLLGAADVDDVRKYVLDMRNSNNAPGPANEAINAIQNRLGQLASAPSQQQLPIVPASPAPTPLSTNGQVPPAGF